MHDGPDKQIYPYPQILSRLKMETNIAKKLGSKTLGSDPPF